MNPRLLAAACAALCLGTAAHASLLSYTLSGGSGSGRYSLGGATTVFSNATFVFAANADPSQMVSGVSSVGGFPLSYIPIASVTITMTSGSTVTTFTAGPQNVTFSFGDRTLPLAVASYRDPSGGFSGIGFGFLDVAPNADAPFNSPATPYYVSMAQGMAGGSGVFTNLQTAGTFAGINFAPTFEIQVVSGGQSGVLSIEQPAGAAAMTIATVVPGPGGMALVGALACIPGLATRRRRR